MAIFTGPMQPSSHDGLGVTKLIPPWPSSMSRLSLYARRSRRVVHWHGVDDVDAAADDDDDDDEQR
jgi:hypothetical protein